MPAISAIGSQYNMQAYYAANISAARTAAANPSQPNAPVEPVSAVRQVAPDTSVRMPVAVQEPTLPTVDDLNNASENLARMRIEYPEEAAQSDMQGLAQAQSEPQGVEAMQAQAEEEEPQGVEAMQAQSTDQTNAQAQNAVAVGINALLNRAAPAQIA